MIALEVLEDEIVEIDEWDLYSTLVRPISDFLGRELTAQEILEMEIPRTHRSRVNSSSHRDRRGGVRGPTMGKIHGDGSTRRDWRIARALAVELVRFLQQGRSLQDATILAGAYVTAAICR